MTAGDAGIVVVGASLAGQRACAALRRHGYRGRLTVVGAEPHLPYDRPPLSKELLAATADESAAALPSAGLGIDWVLGRRARRLDVPGRTVELDGGDVLPFTGLVVATGSAPNPWPGTHPPEVGVFRTLDDARALRHRLGGGDRLLVIGAGFLGGELAAAARGRGTSVELVEAQPQPLRSALGPVAGEFVAALHRAAGVSLRTRTRVGSFTGGHRLTGAILSDGTRVAADLAVVALGASPGTGWLAGAGLRINRGLVCDQHARALGTDGAPVPGIVVAGDVARWPHPSAGPDGAVLGHWTHAVEQAEVAARNVLDPAHPATYRPVPSFWSDLYGVRLRAVGFPAFADTVEVHENDPDGGRLDIAYRRDGELVGVLTGNRPGRLAAYRAQLAEALGRVPA
ncbi:NAD(P)/FAD-dependent oxidoreductase [Amycolatopsis sp. 3B14]|uniref:NAD(P)/FAD-dependent oxidoreductase n=1 Tax=Amycolatopsis sp. 3B14 TaxID=3243600 RepID=UPI003D98A1A7